MAKTLKKVEQEQRVFSIIQAQIDGQRQNVETIQLMLNEIRSVRDEVNEVKKEVNKKFEEMSEMVQEVRDSTTLTDTECYDLQSAVATKSISLAKDRFDEAQEEFPKIVGKYRWMIWKHLKRHYHVPKYNHIRRIDFKDSIQFVFSFTPEDYI